MYVQEGILQFISLIEISFVEGDVLLRVAGTNANIWRLQDDTVAACSWRPLSFKRGNSILRWEGAFGLGCVEFRVSVGYVGGYVSEHVDFGRELRRKESLESFSYGFGWGPKEKVKNGKWIPEPGTGLRENQTVIEEVPHKPLRNQERTGGGETEGEKRSQGRT